MLLAIGVGVGEKVVGDWVKVSRLSNEADGRTRRALEARPGGLQ